MPSKSITSFAAFMILVPTSFFLGMLFSLLPYDYPLLWSSAPVSPAHLDVLETHLKLLHGAPNIFVRMMHIVTVIGLTGLVIKLYKPSESNVLFDGGSLVLYMIAIIVYLTNIVKGLRIVSEGSYGLTELKQLNQDQLDNVDAFGNDAETGYSILGREDNLKVLAASNTITALVLVGVVVLQVGQWYADRVDSRERQKALEEQQKKAAERAQNTPASDGEHVKRSGSAREGKKNR